MAHQWYFFTILSLYSRIMTNLSEEIKGIIHKTLPNLSEETQLQIISKLCLNPLKTYFIMSVPYRCVPLQLTLRQPWLYLQVLSWFYLVYSSLIDILHCYFSLNVQMVMQGEMHVAITWKFQVEQGKSLLGAGWSRLRVVSYLKASHQPFWRDLLLYLQSAICLTSNIKKKLPALWNSFRGETAWISFSSL